MRFCPTCDNKLYIGLNVKTHETDLEISDRILYAESKTGEDEIPRDDILIYYCTLCNYIDNQSNNSTGDSAVVLSTQFKKSETQFNYINRYTKLDPTLPRIYNMRCPNKECKTNVEKVERPEIIYMRYDDENMKYLYLCVECDTNWKTDERK